MEMWLQIHEPTQEAASATAGQPVVRIVFPQGPPPKPLSSRARAASELSALMLWVCPLVNDPCPLWFNSRIPSALLAYQIASFNPIDDQLQIHSRGTRHFRTLRTPLLIQRHLESLPYHHANTTWSTRQVFRKEPPTALKARSLPRLPCGSTDSSLCCWTFELSATPTMFWRSIASMEAGRDRQIELCLPSLSRSRLSLTPRTRNELL